MLYLSLAAVCTLPTYLASANLLVLNRYWATFFIGATAIIVVLVGGGVAGTFGMSAVEAGCLSVFIGSLTRLTGENCIALGRAVCHPYRPLADRTRAPSAL